MPEILVAGLIDIETTVRIDEFPISYTPIDYAFNGIESSVSGVGFNIAKALKTLGAKPRFLSLIGNDPYTKFILDTLADEGIDASYIKPVLGKTAVSVVLYDRDGKRKIILDLKDIQDHTYPEVPGIFNDTDLAVLCNINFARRLLLPAKRAGIRIATDVHTIKDPDDIYNSDFMANADVLFLSNELIKGRERQFIAELAKKYSAGIIVVGMGEEGALLYVRQDGTLTHIPAVKTREVVCSIGAGDALFSAFIYFYCKNPDPYRAIKYAAVFASYKIGERGAANGFLSEAEFMDRVGSLF